MTEESPREYASFWERFFAFVIDCLILLILAGVLLVLYVLLGTSLSQADPETQAMGAFSQLILLFFWPAACAVYFVVFWTRYGQTPGKMVVSLKVVQTDGSSLSLNKALVRFIGFITVPLLFLIIAFDSRKQGLHDKMAGTYVVRASQ